MDNGYEFEMNNGIEMWNVVEIWIEYDGIVLNRLLWAIRDAQFSNYKKLRI